MLIYSEYKNTFFFISKINGVIKYMLVFSLLGFCLLHSKSLFCVIKHCLTIVFIYMITWYPLCDVFIHPSNVLLIGHLEISTLILKNRSLMIFLIKLFKISFYSFICQGSTSVVVCMWGQRTTRGCWLLPSTLSFQGGMQVFRLGNKSPYLRSQITSSTKTLHAIQCAYLELFPEEKSLAMKFSGEKTIHCEASQVLPVCCNTLCSIRGT